MPSFVSFFKKAFSLNTQSLSYFRIGIWVILIFDLCRRMFFFDALFLDHGIMPIDLLLNRHNDSAFWSLYTIIKAQRWTILMLVMHWVVVICYTLWWKTKEMAVLVWIFTCSLYGRNPMILNGWDTLMRVGLFWAMFLPVWDHYSLDAKQKIWTWQWKQSKNIWNVATTWMIVQLLCVYIFSFIMKTDPIWNQQFTAIYYALSLDAFRTPLWDFLYTQPGLMKFFTAVTYFIEWYGALLLFIPRKSTQMRKWAILLFILFHLWLASSMHLGPFPFIAIVYWIALWHPRPWKKISYHNTLHPLVEWWLVLVLWLIICWNIRTTDFEHHAKRFPRTVNRIVFTARVEQSWSMFSPYPFRDDGWYVITGTDIYWNDRVVNKELPWIQYGEKWWTDRSYSSELRHKYYSNMRKKKNSYLRVPFLERACTTLPDIKRLSMDYTREFTLPDYEHKPHETINLATLTCR